MKKIIFTMFLAAMSLSAFGQAGEVLDITIDKFARDGRNVDVEFTINVDGRHLRTTEAWTIIPSIRAGATVKQLEPIAINGRNKSRMIERDRVLGGHRYSLQQASEPIGRREVRAIKYRQTVPYEDWMRNATLVFDEVLVTCSHRFTFLQTMANIHAPQPPAPYVMTPMAAVIIPVQEEVKERAISATAHIDFHVNRMEIVRDFRNNSQELNKINTTLREVRDNADMTFRGIYLHGFASPDGPYANNERLARGRVEALKNYVSTNFGVPVAAITTNYTAEDWVGFRELVEKSIMEGRQEILTIIDSGDAPDAKEARIRQIRGGQPWRLILAEMMPSLRRTDYRVDFTVREYNVHDARAVLETNPSLLSHYELYQLAQEHANDAQLVSRIYGIIERQFPTDDVANLNVAAFKIGRGDFAGARINLDRVSNNRNNNTALNNAFNNNLGVVNMMQGRYDEARQAFRQAGNLTEAQHNLRELDKFIETQRVIQSFN
ncbi:MAG: hypothetical protein FWE10_05445 [Rikenellaceae bacterium]|nr:hypothetical protein [Rikenellaceae bacterium]MCL2693318.1 hypothetical protein [Rikenellaceae bacterium]